MNMDRRRGFTLVEMLVALLLLSLLSVVIGSGLYLGLRSWQGIDQHQQQAGDAYLVQHALRRLLGATTRSVVQDEDRGRQLAFHGNAEELLWVAPLQQYDQGDSLSWLWLGYLDTGEEDMPAGLYLAHAAFNGLADQDVNQQSGLTSGNLDWNQLRFQLTQDARKTLLMAGSFADFRLEYLRVEQDEPPRWEQEWQYEDSLPALISVHFQDGDRAPWPILKVRPKADAYVVKRDR
ncbi:prepilin-type N-terminal cleavage/methylation domain-containing protein [Pontibacter sp. JAM-7]|uniref:prepilin-type N-terminal cleavage/methylation domain-containing protein n=1 Tax=Pontibacter sp. JAM-7 TaxID=3366581 RepID=UPI003AF536D2